MPSKAKVNGPVPLSEVSVTVTLSSRQTFLLAGPLMAGSSLTLKVAFCVAVQPLLSVITTGILTVPV